MTVMQEVYWHNASTLPINWYGASPARPIPNWRSKPSAVAPVERPRLGSAARRQLFFASTDRPGSRTMTSLHSTCFRFSNPKHYHDIETARAKATFEAIPSARAFALLVCGELSDCDPPMCFKLFVSSAVPSAAFLSSSLIALTMSDCR